MSILKQITKGLNIEQEEITPVMLLIIQSVFIGIFYGSFDIGAHTLFLKTFPEEMIPKAYIISGLLGILLTTVFSKLQSKIRFSVLANSTLLFISVVTVLARVFFELTNASWTVFFVFILLGPLNILAILAFWGTVGRIFTLRQGKRLYGIIDTGQIFGIIISSYAIPLVIVVLKGTDNLLIFSSISIIGSLIIEAYTAKKYKIDRAGIDEESDDIVEKEQLGIKSFIKDKYILFMSLFVIFSMFAAFFVQYSFLVVTNEQYPLEDDLAKYLGFFTGSMMIFTFLIKTFVYSKLVKTYGLKVSLMLSPLLIALFTGIAIVIGVFGGYDKASAGFIYFFLFISMSKLFNKTLKDALEMPSFKLLYQSLSKAIRFDVQAKVDGTINEISALVSGLLLSGLGMLAFIKLIHFSVFLFALLIVWVFITVRLYKEYRKSLERTLKQNTNVSDNQSEGITDIVVRELEDIELLSRRLSIVRTYMPPDYVGLLLSVTDKISGDDIMHLPYIHRIEIYLQYLKQNLPAHLLSYFDKYEEYSDENISIKRVADLLKSEDVERAFSVLKYLHNIDQKTRLTFLSGLIREPDRTVQDIGIRLVAIENETELVNAIFEFIETQLLFSPAYISLSELAKDNSVNVFQLFYKTDITVVSQLIVIDLISRNFNTNNKKFLLDNISSHKKEIKAKVTEVLSMLNYTPSEDELPVLFHPITEAAHLVAWDISALASLGSNYDTHILKKALLYELARHRKLLFEILSIAYDSQSISRVKEYLDSGTGEGTGYALELFDLFISEEIKPMILAVFEDTPYTDKTLALEEFFPVKVMTIKELILSIINRNPNHISTETKKIALAEYVNYFEKLTDDIVAHLFNPNPMLQSVAALSINKIDKDKIRLLKKRMTTDIYRNIEKSDGLFFSVFSFDKLVASKLFVDSDDMVEIGEYLEIKSNILKQKSLFNNYFVFLIFNPSRLSADDVQMYFNGNYIDVEDKDSILVGIGINNFNKLLLSQGKIAKKIVNVML